MLTVSNLSKQFTQETKPLFQHISFTLNAGERIGLIGRNGSGKTTLLKIILGEEAPTSGSIVFNPPDLRMGYLSQGLEVAPGTTIRDILFPAEAEVERLALALETAEGVALEQLLAAYGEALEKVDYAAPTEKILADLELDHLDLTDTADHLSGGQKTRLGLAALLLKSPQLLILDEPTNHLDILALEWLESWLQDFEGGVLMVSHDRTFLDETVNRIFALEKARMFEGNYSDYVAAVQSELDKQWAQWKDQQDEVARLEMAVNNLAGKALTVERGTKPNAPSLRRQAKKVAHRAKAKQRQLDRYLESDERVDKPKPTWNLKLDFDDLPLVGRDVLFLEDLSVGYGEPLLEHLDLAIQGGERVVMLGANGEGKSTLIKTIIGQLPPLAGRVRLGVSVRIGYLAQQQEILEPEATALDLLLKIVPLSHTEGRSFLHFFLFEGDDPLRPVGQLSYGERARLMLALAVARGANVLILDEPINHLDVPSREQFEQALKVFKGAVLVVSHDRYFVDQFASKVWIVGNGTIVEEAREGL